METVLIAGGAGFIGSAVIRHLLDETEAYVVNIDKLTYASNLSSIPQAANHPRYHFARVDICDGPELRRLFDDYSPHYVMNLAAESHVDRSIDGPAEFIQTNIVGTFTLLQEALHYWRRLDRAAQQRFRFHHISTDEVFGSLGPEGLFTENTPYAPNSPYSASKAASDHLVRAWRETYGLPTLITNCSNNYGPYHFPEKLIPLTIVNALDGKKLPVYGDGLQVRDWLYVRDHCRGIERVLEKGRLGETYNLGGNSERKNIDVVKAVCRHINKIFADEEKIREQFPKCPAALGGDTAELIAFVKDRPGHDRRYAIDAMKATLETGYGPAESFDTGLLKTVRWFIANEAWWRSVMDGSYRDWVELHYSEGKKAGS